jgi:hypothetical protein
MYLIFLFACYNGEIDFGNEGDHNNSDGHVSASDTNNGTGGVNWGASGGSSSGGSSTDDVPELRSGVFGMRDIDNNLTVVVPDSYDEVTLIVECPIGIDDNHSISSFTVQVRNEVTGDETFWFGNQPLITADIDLWDDTYCFWSEVPLTPGDSLIINGDIVGGSHSWLAENDSTSHCNVQVVEPGGAWSRLYAQPNWNNTGRDFVYNPITLN